MKNTIEKGNNNYNHRRYHHNWYNKSNIISYIKKFETFEEGFSEVITYNPELKNYCGRDPILVDVVSSMLNSIKDNIPSVDNYNYPNTLSLSITAKEVGFKTDINIALGWKSCYDFNTGKSYYVFRVSFLTIPFYKKAAISDMMENGWNKVDKEENKVIKNKPKNKNKKEIKQKIVTIPKEEQKYVKLDQGIDVEVDDDIEFEEEIDKSNIDKEIINDINSSVIIENDSEEKESKTTQKIITDNKEENNNDNDMKKIENSSNSIKDSVIASPVNGTFIVTHNNQTSVININEPNKNGLIVDKEEMTVTFPDGTKINLNI